MAKINSLVGNNIRRARLKKKWSQEKLALEAGLHRAYVGHIERGEKNLGLKNLERLAVTLGMKTVDLLKER